MEQAFLTNKRTSVDEAEASNAEAKRPRIYHSGALLSEHVGATELVSAFALASLASMGSRDQKDEREEQVESREELHDDVVSQVAPTDEPRSPVRSNKRVTFSTDTKDVSRKAARRLSLPPRSKNAVGPRLPPPFVRGHSFPTSPPAHHFPKSRQQQHYQTWMRPRLLDHHHPMSVVQTPPAPPPRPPESQTDKWICDFCNVAAFDSYEEACAHESTCPARFGHPPPSPSWQPPMPPARMMYHQLPASQFPGHPRRMLAQSYCRPIAPKSQCWYSGSTSLALPDSDPDWLSALNCFIRKSCVEVFSATEQDVAPSSKRGRIAPLQVGIRCCFCKHRHREDLQVAAISYPVSVAGIYESVKRWQKVHVGVCQDIPVEVTSKLDELATGNSWVPTTRQYWADAARSLGMVDTQEGIRFAKDPSRLMIRSVTVSGTEITRDAPPEARNDEESPPSSTERLSDGDSIVYPQDMALVPAYVYFLIRQVEATHFTESDRFVARSKGPLGYPGFQCRHCRGHAGLGKYFPVSAKSLSTNSTSQNIHSHLLKCRKVSPYVKEQLIALKEEKSKAPRLEPGWRRVFFDKIWHRLHGEE